MALALRAVARASATAFAAGVNVVHKHGSVTLGDFGRTLPKVAFAESKEVFVHGGGGLIGPGNHPPAGGEELPGPAGPQASGAGGYFVNVTIAVAVLVPVSRKDPAGRSSQVQPGPENAERRARPSMHIAASFPPGRRNRTA